ncbi:MAG: hypothetical protein JXR71_06670 [Bacteroidales bacterium]|nr:hypothetical protein [Bacteroidales bacterium]
MKARSIFSVRFQQGYFTNHRRNNPSNPLSSAGTVSVNNWMSHSNFFVS